jgi:hypothetical protein
MVSSELLLLLWESPAFTTYLPASKRSLFLPLMYHTEGIFPCRASLRLWAAFKTPANNSSKGIDYWYTFPLHPPCSVSQLSKHCLLLPEPQESVSARLKIARLTQWPTCAHAYDPVNHACHMSDWSIWLE